MFLISAYSRDDGDDDCDDDDGDDNDNDGGSDDDIDMTTRTLTLAMAMTTLGMTSYQELCRAAEFYGELPIVMTSCPT